MVIGGLGLAVSAGLVLALVVLTRHRRWASVRAAERLALGLASLALLGGLPNLDEAVNAYYVAVGSASLDFGVGHAGCWRPSRAGVPWWWSAWSWSSVGRVEGSKVAPTLTVIGIVVGLILWFWGRVGRPPGIAVRPGAGPAPRTLCPGAGGLVAVALRRARWRMPATIVTWAFLATLAVRSWWDGRRHEPPWV